MTYTPKGMLLILNGWSITLPLSMSVGAMGHSVAELREFYS